MSTLYERAAIIPGHSMTRSKAPGRFYGLDEGPLYCSRGQGAYVYDEKEQAYLDMLCGLGAISLGYRQHLAERRAPSGVYSLPHLSEMFAAEDVLQHVAPWASSVRFVKTGSEATHAAYRIAKQATGRRRVVVGDWAYHGWHEWSAIAGKYPHGWSLGRLYETQALGAGDIAAVFIEPHRWEPVDVEWLKSVRDFCDRVGALLVFDSMIYGGRWALGGASQYFGVQPDMETFGKAYGNGQSVAFVVGNAALQEHGEMVSGTYSGDVVGLAAVLTTLQVYTTEPVIETLWTRGRQLAQGLDSVLMQYPALQGVREGQPVHQRIRFADPTLGKRFSAEMAKRRILWHPDVANICFAHTAEHMEQVIDAAAASCAALTRETP